MPDTTKLLMVGQDQAVLLPSNYRFDGTEVYIRKDPETGDVIISEKPAAWNGLFELQDEDEGESPDDFTLDLD